MKVYVVMEHDALFGVFKSLKKAKEAMKGYTTLYVIVEDLK